MHPKTRLLTVKIVIGAHALVWYLMGLYGAFWGRPDIQEVAFLFAFWAAALLTLAVMLDRAGRWVWLTTVLAILADTGLLTSFVIRFWPKFDPVAASATLSGLVALVLLWRMRGYCGVGKQAVREPETELNYCSVRLARYSGAAVASAMLMGVACGVMLSQDTKIRVFAVIAIPSFMGLYAFSLNRAMTWLRGLKGEFSVNAILSQLGPGCRVLENLELEKGRGDIDHVVVAPNGVWVIETKHLDGAVTVKDGRLLVNDRAYQKNFLQQTFAEARAVRDCLVRSGIGAPVFPVLIFSGYYARVRFGTTPVNEVFVIGSSWLLKLIYDPRFPNTLSSTQIKRIYDALIAAEEQAE
jgi:hypothetical protein